MEKVEEPAQEVGADKADNGEDQANKKGLAEDARVLEVRENQHVGEDGYPEADKYIGEGLEQACPLGLALLRGTARCSSLREVSGESQGFAIRVGASCNSLREARAFRPGAALLREAFWAKLHQRLSLAILALMV